MVLKGRRLVLLRKGTMVLKGRRLALRRKETTCHPKVLATHHLKWEDFLRHPVTHRSLYKALEGAAEGLCLLG
jgi:hypothetical protein